MLRYSKYLAVVLGVIVPVIATHRRWRTWQSDPSTILDDYIFGGFLLYGARRVNRNAAQGQKFLTLAWGFAFALVYHSFFWQLRMIEIGEPDPSGISNELSLALKTLGFFLLQ